jgi:hypothetical protein
VLTEADIRYVRANFTPLADLVRRRGQNPDEVYALVADERLPKPSYVLDDGTEMVPHDYFELAEAAGGFDLLREHFLERYEAAAAAEPEVLDEPEEEWEAYLSGDYGVCLRQVTPENIARKSALVLRIEALLDDPRPEDAGWGDFLAAAVAELDRLEREFAAYDRVRWGLVSRDRLIAAPRDAYPHVFLRAAGARSAP